MPPYGLPDEMPPMADDEPMAEEEEGAEDDPETMRLAAEAFPGVEVNGGALQKLLRHCFDKYGDSGLGEEEEEMGPPPDKKKALILAFGKPKE